MALRSFFAFDSEALVVTSSRNSSLIGTSVRNNSDTPDRTTFIYNGGSGETITLNDTDNRNVFDDDDENDHRITDGGSLVADGTRVESESRIWLRALDEDGNETGPVITMWVFSKDGDYTDVWGFSTDTPLEPGTSYVKVKGSNNGDSKYTSFITCFAAGTPIDTPDGPVAAEDLRVGQAVWTRDGPEEIRWVASTEVEGTGAFAPVVFAPGAFGNDTELVVSQQHRMLVESARAELYFGEPAVLVPAKHLCGLPGVTIRPCAQIRYTHFMCDRHVIVRAAGALSESFFLAEHSLGALDEGARRELLALFPSLTAGLSTFGGTAATTLKARETAALRASL